jgi:hypothetical protein
MYFFGLLVALPAPGPHNKKGELRSATPGTLMSWVTSWPKLLWYLGSSHPKLKLGGDFGRKYLDC